ncbi:MAG: type I methionyl aminopeptidase [Lachnospirales bacterium]
MSITIKREFHIEKMRVAGRITGETLNLMEKSIKPGITTLELDKIAEEYIRSQGAYPSFKGLYGYPASICASVNEEVIHGIPNNRKLQEGDIISIDTGAYINGFHGDAARTFAVGKISADRQRLIDITKESFFRGIEFAKSGNHLIDISAAIQDFIESNGYAVVRDYVGHGIGREMHEDPNVPNYRTGRKGPKLMTGMTLAIEPMVTAGNYKVKTLSNKWTVVTKDGSDAAHYENTVYITDGKPELLTLV